MSATAVTASIALGMGVLTGGAYALREYYFPMKSKHLHDKDRIRELEEEIVRLKREMRICGLLTESEDSKNTPRK